MLTALGLIFATLWIPGLLVFVTALRRAPVGYEDARGFHTVAAAPEEETLLVATARAG